jgi:hypothetical protein
MRKQFFAIIFAIGLAVSAHAQNSQAIRADIPFAFTVNGRTLPAGTYRIDSASGNRIVWKLQSTEARSRLFVLANTLSGNLNAGHVQLTFHRYGTQNYLAAFETSSYRVSLPPSNREKAIRGPATKAANYDVIKIDAAPTSKVSY